MLFAWHFRAMCFKRPRKDSSLVQLKAFGFKACVRTDCIKCHIGNGVLGAASTSCGRFATSSWPKPVKYEGTIEDSAQGANFHPPIPNFSYRVDLKPVTRKLLFLQVSK